MSQQPNLDFTVDKEARTITIRRTFAAELSLVWDAYTKSEILDQWWAPKPWKARTKTMDFREGGQWHYAMVGPEGQEHWSVTNYQHIEPQQSFTGLDAFTDAQGRINNNMPQSRWKVSFTAKGQETEVTCHIAYDDLAQLEATLEMGFKEGVTIAMEGLDQLLASLKNQNA